MNRNLVAIFKTSFLVIPTFVAYIQVRIWNIVFDFLKVAAAYSTHFDEIRVVETSSGACKRVPFTVMEMDLNFVISHALHHPFRHLKLSQGST